MNTVTKTNKLDPINKRRRFGFAAVEFGKMNQPAKLHLVPSYGDERHSEIIEASLSADGKTLTIGVHGHFDFTVHQAFCGAYEKISVSIEHFVVDLYNATGIDNSALGMLLLLRDHAVQQNAELHISNIMPGLKHQMAVYGFMMPFSIA